MIPMYFAVLNFPSTPGIPHLRHFAKLDRVRYKIVQKKGRENADRMEKETIAGNTDSAVPTESGNAGSRTECQRRRRPK